MSPTASPARIYPAASHAKRAALAVALAGTLLLIAGCGDDATSKYRSAAQIAGNDFNQIAGPALRHLSTAPSPPARVAAVQQFKRAVDSAARRFAELDPPAKAKADNAALVAEFRQLSHDLGRYESALQFQDPIATHDLAGSVKTDFARIQQVGARLNRDVGA